MPDWYTEPNSIIAIIQVILGFWLLIKGADLLVEGAVYIAGRLGLAPAVIGATVVAFGTSLPELMVSLFSLREASQGEVIDPNGPVTIAMGNVVGSNMFNIGAVLGLTALCRAVPIARSSVRLDYPLMLVVSILLVSFSWYWGVDGNAHVIHQWEGALFLVGLAAFIYMSVRLGKVDKDEIEDLEDVLKSPVQATLFIVLGIIMLAMGGDATLTGAVAVAESLGLSQRVIGLTVVALGTSLPEMVTSVQAARKGHAEMAIANILGSNVFNVLCILGISALIVPLPVSAGTLGWDYWWMLGFALILLPMMLKGRSIVRWQGVVLLVLMVSYITLLICFPSLGGLSETNS